MKEEGPKEMTLDEWKAMQDKERAKVEFNIRKVNEGEDWQKGFVLHKSKAGVSWMLFVLNPFVSPMKLVSCRCFAFLQHRIRKLS